MNHKHTCHAPLVTNTQVTHPWLQIHRHAPQKHTIDTDTPVPGPVLTVYEGIGAMVSEAKFAVLTLHSHPSEGEEQREVPSHDAL